MIKILARCKISTPNRTNEELISDELIWMHLAQSVGITSVSRVILSSAAPPPLV